MRHVRLGGILLMIALVACGEDSTGPEDGGGNPEPTATYGFFIDAAVQGLEYRVADGPVRVTDENGAFEFEVEQPVTFLVSGVELGTVATPRTRITPNDFGVAGTNIARFLQSIDTRPSAPQIDLTGLTLAAGSIDFAQSAANFGSDALVQQALTASQSLGGTGVLLSASQASAHLSAALNPLFALSEFEDRMYVTLSPEPDAEVCIVRFGSDGTGLNVCQDDIDESPGDAAFPFEWTVDETELQIEFSEQGSVVERVEAQKLGTTGNRLSLQVTSECLTCNPATEPTFEASVETFAGALPTSSADVEGRTLMLSPPDGPAQTAIFNANGTGSLDDGEGGLFNFLWSLDDPLVDVIRVRGTGAAGSQMIFLEAMLIEGTWGSGLCAILAARGTDLDQSGDLSESELFSTALFEGVEVVPVATSVPSPATPGHGAPIPKPGPRG